MASHNDDYIRFFTRMLRHLTNDPYIETSIEWNAQLYCYNFHIVTSHGTYSFTLRGDGSARQWPPPIALLGDAIDRFREVYPELLV